MNMPAVAQGFDVTVLNLTGVNYSPLGVPTFGSTLSMQGFVRRLRHGARRTFEDWRPLTSLQIHNIMTGEGNECELAELVQRGVPTTVITIFSGFSHVIVSYVKGPIAFNPAYFRVGDWEGAVEGPGGMEETLQLLPYNPGGPQVTRTA